jgi:hypothetical protein
VFILKSCVGAVVALCLVAGVSAAKAEGAKPPAGGPSRPAAGQTPSAGGEVPKTEEQGQVSPPDVQGWLVEPDLIVDEAALLKHGFIPEVADDHLGEDSRKLVAEKFMDAIGRTAGRKPPFEFGFDLMDLTGSGFNSLVLWPRVYQLYPVKKADGMGGPLYVYVFDGKTWKKALQDYAVVLAVRPHFDAGGKPTGAQDLALADQDKYRLFVFDADQREYVLKGVSHYDKDRAEYVEVPR